MEWITNLFSLIGMLLTPIFPMVIFLMKRKEVRATKRAEINQQHIKGIHLIIWHNPKEFDSNCIQSLQLLSNSANLAESFDRQVWKDIKDTAEKVQELRQIFGFLSNGGLAPQKQEHYSERQATLTSELMTKLQRI